MHNWVPDVELTYTFYMLCAFQLNTKCVHHIFNTTHLAGTLPLITVTKGHLANLFNEQYLI